MESDQSISIGELLTELQSPNYNYREDAVRELSEIEHDEAIAGLVIALEDPDLGIRELAADYLVKKKNKLTCRLLVKYLGSDDIGTRNLASESLIRIGREAIPYLLEQINNDDHDIRKFIVDILGIIKNAKAIDHLCGKLNDCNLNVVCSAAEALGEIGDVRVIPNLVEAYERYEEARLPVVEALGKIKDERSLGFLYDILDTKDKMILLVTIDAIGQIQNKDSIVRLIPFLENADKFVAESALLSIINIIETYDIQLDFDIDIDNFKDFLVEGIKKRNKKITKFTLDHSDDWINGKYLNQFLSALSNIDESQLIKLTDILKKIDTYEIEKMIMNISDSSSSQKINFLKLISQYMTPEIGKALIIYKKDPDPSVRRQLAESLGEISSDDTIATLKELSSDEVGDVRATAYKSLGKIKPENEIDHLFKGLNDRYPDVRESSMKALISIGNEEIIGRFNDDLYSDNIERQRIAILALGMIHSKNAVKPLLDAVKHPDCTIRKSAIESLRVYKEIDNIEPILLALKDENSTIRKTAASTLLSLKGKDCLGQIKFLLEDYDVWVRYHVINLIGDMGDYKNVELIKGYLYEDQDLIKIATLKALSKIGSIELLEEINKLKFESNRDVQEAACLAVSNLQGIDDE